MFSIHIKTNKSQHRLFDEYVEAPSVSCPYIIFMLTLLVARFHTSANLYWQLFWQNYTVPGSNFQVSAKTRHFYYQQPFPFPVRLKELFKLISVSDDCFVNKRREGKDICTSLTSMHYFDQGCISCGILVSRIQARGVSSEHMENMEMFSYSPT